jgi:hypothetical protein
VEEADILLWRPAPSTLFLGGWSTTTVQLYAGTAEASLPPVGVAWTVRCLPFLSSCSARNPLTRNSSRGGLLVLSSFSRRSPHEVPPHEDLLRWASVIGLPLGRSWAVEGAQEQVDQDTPVSRTPIVALGSLAHERALLRERRVRGPPEATGPSNGTRQCTRSEDHVKMQRTRMRGATTAGETKRRATQQSPRRQTAMMARHFTAGHCADAPIPMLGLGASTPATPFKCSFLDALGTSPTSSSATSSLDIFPSHGSLASSAAAGSVSSGTKCRGRPPGQQE